MAVPRRVFIMARASVPPLIAARAGIVMSVTFGVSFVIIEILSSILFLTLFTIFSTCIGSVPNAIPPFSILGQETLISIAEII